MPEEKMSEIEKLQAENRYLSNIVTMICQAIISGVPVSLTMVQEWWRGAEELRKRLDDDFWKYKSGQRENMSNFIKNNVTDGG